TVAARVRSGQARPTLSSASALELLEAEVPARCNPAGLIVELQALMQEKVGPFRRAAPLEAALAKIAELRAAMGEMPPRTAAAYDTVRLDWFDLRNMLLVAEAVTQSALARRESRGAHQREDYPKSDEGWSINQSLRLEDNRFVMTSLPVTRARA